MEDAKTVDFPQVSKEQQKLSILSYFAPILEALGKKDASNLVLKYNYDPRQLQSLILGEITLIMNRNKHLLTLIARNERAAQIDAFANIQGIYQRKGEGGAK